VLFANGFTSALWLHAFTGLCQGGTYTPALALINEHVEHERRGRAMGYLIAGSSAGYAIALGVAGLALRYTDWRGALAAVAVLPVASWVLGVLLLRGTPNVVHPRPGGEPLLAALPAVLRNRRGMLSIWSYTFHNWELLGLWAWLPAFLTAALLAHGMGAQWALLLAALTYVANIAGSIVGGTMADRWGRIPTLLTWSCISTALSFAIGWLISLPIAVLVAIACFYNFAAIADSSTHSTVLAEGVPPHYIGVAYAVRSLVGFGAGVVSPVVFGWALDLAGGAKTSTDAFAWGVAWSTLGLGALFGPIATWRMRRQ
jgi:MFS family permease